MKTVEELERLADTCGICSARSWLDAINYHGGYGIWRYVVCKSRTLADETLRKLREAGLSEFEKTHVERR